MATAEDVLSRQHPNVGNPERWVSVVGGSALAAYGLTRRSTTGFVLAALGGVLVWRGATGQCPVYSALGVSTAEDEEQGSHVSVRYGRGIRVEKSVVVNAPPDRVYTFWRRFENLPQFMNHLQSVDVHDNIRSHWVTKGPAGMNAEWDAEIINEIPNELIGWRSVDGSRVDNAGSVHFKATGGGTTVTVLLRYDPPAGKAGAAFAKLFGEDPDKQVDEDLERLRQLLEVARGPSAV